MAQSTGQGAEPIPLRDLLAGHTLWRALVLFEEAMDPFVKAAMREAFPDRDPADPEADDYDKERHAALAKREAGILARDQRQAAKERRLDEIRTQSLPAAEVEATRLVAEEQGYDQKRADNKAGVNRLKEEIKELKGLDGFTTPIADQASLVQMKQKAAKAVGKAAGLNDKEQKKLWAIVSEIQAEENVRRSFFIKNLH